MNRSWILLVLVSTTSFAQKVEERQIDIVYGDEIIRGTLQVVIDNEYDADVIPFDKDDLESKIPSNVVISATDTKLSYVEEEKLAEREAAIYDEVNRRTENAPYTVLFTGHIPEHIQKERMKMMPEVGIFGTQLRKLDDNQGSLENLDVARAEDTPSLAPKPDLGEFLPIKPGGGNNTSDSSVNNDSLDESISTDESSSNNKASAASMLEDMIGL